MKKIITIISLVLIILFFSCNKHKEMKVLETININNNVKTAHLGYASGAVYLQNNRLIGLGDTNPYAPSDGIKIVGKIIKVGTNIILSNVHEEKATASEEKMVDFFYSNWMRFSKMSAKVNSDIKKIIPKHLKVRYVYRDDLNSDGKKDYFLFAMAPERSEMRDIYTIIILSHNNKYFLQYLDYWGDDSSWGGDRFLDIKTVNLFNDNKKYIAVRSVGIGGKGYSASLELYWLE